MSNFLDFLRVPLRTLKTYYEPKESAEANLQFTVKDFDADSLGQLSGWMDRKGASQGFLGLNKGPVDMQLPESFYADQSELSSLSSRQFQNGWKHNETENVYYQAIIRPEESSRFQQVFIWQPYTRETSMPFSQMPTVY